MGSELSGPQAESYPPIEHMNLQAAEEPKEPTTQHSGARRGQVKWPQIPGATQNLWLPQVHF